MNILRTIGIVCSLSGMSAMVFGVSEAATCFGPSTSQNGPYQLINNQSITCTVSGPPSAFGIGVGRTATSSQPKRICANLQVGRRASVNGFDGINGRQVPNCVAQDSLADGAEFCDLTDCAKAAAFLLTVQTF